MVEESRRLEDQLFLNRDCISSSASQSSTSKKKHVTCTFGYVLQKGACIECPAGKFSLENWIACQPLLGCEHIQHEITQLELLHSLVHWQYYKADWKGYSIIYATFNALARSSINYLAIQRFSPSQNILYPVGSCEEKSIVLFTSNWTFVDVGNRFEAVFATRPLCNRCMVRLHFAMSYLHIIARLHAVDTVLCNSRTLQHLLSQFLITDRFSLVLATQDNLPQDANGPILCQQRELNGRFIAPEQKWPYGAIKIFNPDEQPKYDKTTDIWKVPDVVSAFLTPACKEVVDYLQEIHLKCKDVTPHQRPTAAQLLKEYEHVWDLLFIQSG